MFKMRKIWVRPNTETNFLLFLSIRLVGRLDTWNISWIEVEELRFEIESYNMDVKLWEYFSQLERQNAVDIPGNNENPNENFEEFIAF